MKNDGLFESLDGRPAHILIIVGLVFALYAPLIPAAKWAKVNKARASRERAQQLVTLDLEKYNKDQSTDTSELTFEERRARQEEQTGSEKTKREELEQLYEVDATRRGLIEAEAAVAGVRSHLYIGWLGNLLLVLGLLVLTVQSEGAKQKVLLIILVIVLFSAITGMNLDFSAEGHMGQLPAELERALRNR